MHELEQIQKELFQFYLFVNLWNDKCHLTATK